MKSSSYSLPNAEANLPVPLLDLKRQNEPLQAEISAAMQQVCDSGRFVLGPEVQQLEASVADYCDAEHAIGCASGSDALLLALLALGIGRGHEVIVPSFSFFATAGSVWRAGATPVFADIDPETFGLSAESVEGCITERTKAIIPVHLYGQCAEMDPLWRIATRHQLHIIEDAAQSIGAEYRGRRTGVLGDIACFSFYPTKNLGCYGDGGMLTTNDDNLAEKLRLLRVHGMKPRYHHRVVGVNSRLDSLQAAVLNVKFPHLDRWIEMRNQNAQRYEQLFQASGLPGGPLELPTVSADRRHVWNQYVIRVKDGQRDELRNYLTQQKIGTEIYYPMGLHEQECFARLPVKPLQFSKTVSATREVLALPIFPEITAEEQQRVVAAISEFFQAAAQGKPNYDQRESAA